MPPIEKLRPYGVRVSLPAGDPFRKLLGPEWHRVHWFATPEERDAQLAEARRAVGLDAASRVLLLCTEGATDPEAYARLTAGAA